MYLTDHLVQRGEGRLLQLIDIAVSAGRSHRTQWLSASLHGSAALGSWLGRFESRSPHLPARTLCPGKAFSTATFSLDYSVRGANISVCSFHLMNFLCNSNSEFG